MHPLMEQLCVAHDTVWTYPPTAFQILRLEREDPARNTRVAQWALRTLTQRWVRRDIRASVATTRLSVHDADSFVVVRA